MRLCIIGQGQAKRALHECQKRWGISTLSFIFAQISNFKVKIYHGFKNSETNYLDVHIIKHLQTAVLIILYLNCSERVSHFILLMPLLHYSCCVTSECCLFTLKPPMGAWIPNNSNTERYKIQFLNGYIWMIRSSTYSIFSGG